MFLCFDLPNLSSTLNLTIIELDDGKIYRKALYLMVKTMVSCRFSLKPTQWNYCLPGLLPSDFSAFLGVSKKFKGRRPMSSFWVSTQEVGPVPWANWVFFGRPCLVFWAFRCISYVISIGCIHGIYIYMAYTVYAYMIIYGKGKWGLSLTPWVTTIWMDKWDDLGNLCHKMGWFRSLENNLTNAWSKRKDRVDTARSSVVKQTSFELW